MIMTVVLLYSCISTPMQIALYENLSPATQITNWIVDVLFLIDIFILFNTAIIDDDFQIIDDRYKINKEYLTGWFLIDVIAILPFELMLADDQAEGAKLVRYARIGRITKLLKLMKLMRLVKL